MKFCPVVCVVAVSILLIFTTSGWSGEVATGSVVGTISGAGFLAVEKAVAALREIGDDLDVADYAIAVTDRGAFFEVLFRDPALSPGVRGSPSGYLPSVSVTVRKQDGRVSEAQINR